MPNVDSEFVYPKVNSAFNGMEHSASPVQVCFPARSQPIANRLYQTST